MTTLTLGTPFKRSRLDNFNIYDVLDDSDDATDSPASSANGPVELQEHSALSEVPANEVHGVSRVSPDDLALQLETFHIVTPTKINKTRGLRPRPTIDFSIFDHPAEDQENSKAPGECGGTKASDAVDVAHEVPGG